MEQLNQQLSLQLKMEIPFFKDKQDAVAWMRHFVQQLMNENMNQLFQLLYRFDVPENRLKALLQQYPETDAALIIAELLIERLERTIASRQQFKQPPPEDEAERW